MKKAVSFPVENITELRIRMLNWANRFNIFCFLDNCGYGFQEPAFECLLAAGAKTSISVNAGKAFDSLRKYSDENKQEWLFGHLGYDLKNETAGLQAANFDGIGFSDLHFFVPETVLKLNRQELLIYTDKDAALIWAELCSMPAGIPSQQQQPVTISPRIPKADYVAIIGKLKQHIQRGDCYEINFCQEFFAIQCQIDPLHVYERLSAISPNPFSAFYKTGDLYCCCASPERYLAKTGNQLYSQPIKGTSKRDHKDPVKDRQQKEYLLESEKEKSENVMVVDLVRNDLSRVCKPGTVKVDELFGLYSFPQVHQMISTISGEVEGDVHPADIIAASFPMGSMTGAPKIRVMQLIEQYERSRRGLFSGAIGYFKPVTGAMHDFDFNVVIRSLFYNAKTGYLSFQTGGGITFYSDPEKEYAECLLKAEAMLAILQ